jgi:hypothetical protein
LIQTDSYLGATALSIIAVHCITKGMTSQSVVDMAVSKLDSCHTAHSTLKLSVVSGHKVFLDGSYG